MTRFQILPYAKVDGEWNLPDSFLWQVWQKVHAKDTESRLFFDCQVNDAEAFIEFLKHPSRLVAFVIDAEGPSVVAVAWAVPAGRVMQLHFGPLSIGGYRPEVGQALIGFWKSFPAAVWLVMTPESYGNVRRYIEGLGFKSVGVVPDMAQMVHEGRIEGMAILYGRPGVEV
jgi:hypothetical protein